MMTVASATHNHGRTVAGRLVLVGCGDWLRFRFWLWLVSKHQGQAADFGGGVFSCFAFRIKAAAQIVALVLDPPNDPLQKLHLLPQKGGFGGR
jgi:hypothetical protein